MPIQLISGVEIAFFTAFALSIFAGLLMGAEREARHKDAGISTHMFVIAGSMLFTFISAQIEPEFASRIAAQVVMGIGFLGGGLIIKEGTSVRNLTTAASLWYAAAIGMLFGFGFYFIGIITAIFGVIIPRIPHLQKDVH